MDSRARLAIGGMTTVAASVAVVCAVAMSTSVALADTAGAPAGARAVVVPSASPSSTASPAPVPVQPQVSAPAEQPETVPVPEPEDVAHPGAQSPVGNPSAATEAQLIAGVAASGSWDAVYAWAQNQGWQPARIEAWIARIDAKVAELRAGENAGRLMSPDSGSVNRLDTQLPAQAGDTSGRGQSGSSFGSKREQSQVPPG